MTDSDHRTSSLPSKATTANSKLKRPSIHDQVGLCHLTNHPKASSRNDQTIQHDTTAYKHPAPDRCNPLLVPRQAGKVANEYCSTSNVLPHHLCSVVVPLGYVDSQLTGLSAYRPVDRPGQELGCSESRSTMGAAAISPMERWERETIRDQAWNAVARIHGHHPESSPDINLVQGWMDFLEEIGSGETQLKSFL
jgi:hypothetical protein